MKKELEEKLFEKYPKLLRGRNKSIKKNLLPFGIACDDGWYDLIDETLAKIKEKNEDVKVTQIKEKYGGLRVYISKGNDAIFDIIHEAEEKSASICEKCGSKDAERRSRGGWIKTLCKECNKDWQENRLNGLTK